MYLLYGHACTYFSRRFLGIGVKRFLRTPWEVADALVIAVSLILSFAITDPDGNEFSRLSITLRVFRIIRLVRLVPQCRKCVLSLRLTTSENKRRYREEGYDLDLTYITERVIAMSFPSSGWLALYRQGWVSRFTNFCHIFPLFSEFSYVRIFRVNLRIKQALFPGTL